MVMLTCIYSGVQEAVGLTLGVLPLLVLVRGMQSGQAGGPKALAALGLAVKGIDDLAAVCMCHASLVSPVVRVVILMGKAVELSLLCLIMLLCAKGLGVFRCSLISSETHLLTLISLLGFLAWTSFLMAPDSLYLGLIIDLAVLFCVTMKFLLESQQIMRSLLHREPRVGLIREKVAYFHNFQRYFLLYYTILTLRWVCVPVSYLPLLPDITVYIWLGLALQAAELLAVLPLLGQLLTGECIDVQCTDEEIQLPLYVPCRCSLRANFPVLVLTPGLKQQRYLGVEILTTN